MATASNTPLLFPPPLGLLSSPPGLFHGPPTMQPPPQPPIPQQPTGAPGMVINPTTAAAAVTGVPTTKWNPVHLAASGLAPKRVLSNGSTGAVARKSPNQMRVLCDICNKWICNKYFLRTHKANKHGITDQTAMMTPSSQTTVRGSSAVPLDFSRPGKTNHQPLTMAATEGNSEFYPVTKEDTSAVQSPIMTSWSFTNPNPHSPLSKSPNVLPPTNESVALINIQEVSPF